MKWLQCQEAIDHCSAYLDWVSPLLPVSNSRSMQDSGDFTPSGIKPGHAYRLPKVCPYPNIPVSCLMSVFGALDFVTAFQGFLDKHLPNSRFSASVYDRFNVYKSITFQLPSVPHISDQKQLNKLHACCIIPSNSLHKPDTPAHFDTTLVVHDHGLHHIRKTQGCLTVFFT